MKRFTTLMGFSKKLTNLAAAALSRTRNTTLAGDCVAPATADN